MARLLFERALHADPITGEIYSYWPERWPLEALARELSGMGTAFFAAGYQNDPTALEGNALKVSMLNFYTPGDLIAARAAHNITRGTIYVGIDPDNGGEGPDPDYAGLCTLEKIGNRGYLLPDGFFLKRLSLKRQAQQFEDWLDVIQPNFCTIEDTAAKGYVYTDMTTQINNNRGSKHVFTIEKPQTRWTNTGGKLTSFLSMAARFENAQILVPANPSASSSANNTNALAAGVEVPIHPNYQLWLDQWRSFPSGHDDALDATYWAIFGAFKQEAGVSASKDVDGSVKSAHQTPEEYAAEQARILDALNDPTSSLRDPSHITRDPNAPIGSHYAYVRRQRFGLGLTRHRRDW